MLVISRVKSFVLMSTLVFALVACSSAEERAEEHYQTALELIEAGDVDRAIVELRNVFQLNGRHFEARHLLADLLLNERNNLQGAYGQYLRLVEQYPEDAKARIILSELAFLIRNWEEVDRHGAKAEELAPEDPRVKVISVARAYRTAAIDNLTAERQAQAEIAVSMLDDQPDSAVLRNVLIDSFLRDEQYTLALEQLDWLLNEDRKNPLYWRQRLSILVQLGDNDAIETQLRDMVKQFPNDNSHKLSLIRFFMSRQDFDKAEGFLRELVEQAEPGDPGARLDLIRFLSEIRRPEEALAETQKAITEAEDPIPFRVMEAGLDFSAGRREKAVGTLEDVLKSAEPSEQTRGIKVSLARMLLTMGNEVGARARVEEVLAEDGNNANALKMQAAWLIESDDTDAAISSLRIALEEAPEDAQAMSLMANAYMRAGQPQLANDFLALAVDASNNAPAETIRYARVLIRDENFLAAEDILKKSLRLNQNNIELLVSMGQLYINMDDLPRADQVARALRQLDTPAADSAANGLEAESINRREGPERAMAYLDSIAEEADATLATRVSRIRARLGTGDGEGALELSRELSDEFPDNAAIQAIQATTEAVQGNLAEAEAIYRKLVDENPLQANIWLALSQIKVRQSDPEGGREVIREGLGHMPESPNLLWAQASYFERDGNFDGAIDIYAELYERDSNSIVVANNLASMLSTYRTDEASLERAYVIARRFREADIPALQDTYGWIAHRRGDSQEALPYLEAAAAGLPNDPIVQYHLGQAYLVLGRDEDALTQFRKSVDLAATGDVRPQIAEAQKQIDALQNAQN